MKALLLWGQRSLCAVLVLLGALALSLLAAPAVRAGFDSCRTDPIIYLSDGTVMTIMLDIAADVADVKNIEYAVHVPHGLKMVAVEHTPFPGFRGKEKFSLKDDAKKGEFRTETKVDIEGGKVDVIATHTLDGDIQVVPGRSGDHLKAKFNR